MASRAPNRFLDSLNPEPAQQQIAAAPTNNRFLSQIEGQTFGESTGKSLGRTALQPLQGALEAVNPLEVLNAASSQGLKGFQEAQMRFPEQIGELSPEDLERLQYIQERLPTIENLGAYAEKKTGIPFTAKTGLQKGLRFGSGLAPLTTHIPNVSKVTKPSGLTQRVFESTTKPTNVSKYRARKITEAVENDFNNVLEKIKKEHSATYNEYLNNPSLVKDLQKEFKLVKDLAAEQTQNINIESVANNFDNQVASREKTGFLPSKYDSVYDIEAQQLKSQLTKAAAERPEGITGKTFEEQYRKTNSELKRLNEPNKSGAENDAKIDAQIDSNRALAQAARETYGEESPLVKAFESSNERWSHMADLKKLDTLVEDMFSGKIDYGLAEEYFLGSGPYAKAAKRLLGEEGAEKVSQLFTDLLGTRSGMRYIRAAKADGFNDLAKLATLYFISPKAAAVVHGTKVPMAIWRALLDKPQYAVQWTKGVEAMKAGDWATALAAFKVVDEALKGHSKQNKDSQRQAP